MLPVLVAALSDTCPHCIAYKPILDGEQTRALQGAMEIMSATDGQMRALHVRFVPQLYYAPSRTAAPESWIAIPQTEALAYRNVPLVTAILQLLREDSALRARLQRGEQDYKRAFVASVRRAAERKGVALPWAALTGGARRRVCKVRIGDEVLRVYL